MKLDYLCATIRAIATTRLVTRGMSDQAELTHRVVQALGTARLAFTSPEGQDPDCTHHFWIDRTWITGIEDDTARVVVSASMVLMHSAPGPATEGFTVGKMIERIDNATAKFQYVMIFPSWDLLDNEMRETMKQGLHHPTAVSPIVTFKLKRADVGERILTLGDLTTLAKSFPDGPGLIYTWVESSMMSPPELTRPSMTVPAAKPAERKG